VSPAPPLLAVDGLVAGYGPVTALDRLSFTLPAASRTAMIGRNGAGKSTALKAVMGLAAIRGGRIEFDGEDVTRRSPQARAHLGLGYVPQTRDVFPSLTVEENLIAGLKHRPRADIERAWQWFPRLAERRRHGGGQLSGGEQQMLSVARALLGQPRLLLLDEPLEGLAPLIRAELLRTFQRLTSETGMAVLIVEQHVHEVLAVAEQALIVERGTVVHAGPSLALLANPDLLDRHLGVAVQ
jgi:branched-chain amino acid transport system ATP-binding protein